MKPGPQTGMPAPFRPPLVHGPAGRRFAPVFGEGIDRSLIFAEAPARD